MTEQLCIRLYSKSLDQSSHAQVSRGFRDSLRAAGVLAGEYPLDVEPLPEEPARPGAAASHGVWTGGLAGLPLMRQAGRHGRRWVMVAPNSNRVPPVILKALEAEATDLLVPSAWAQGVMQELTDKLPVSVAPHGIHAAMGSLEFATDFLSGEYADDLGFRVAHFSTSDRQRKGTRELIEAWSMLVARKALPEKAMLFLILDLPAVNQLILEYDGEFPHGVLLRQRLDLEARSMSNLLRTAHLVCQPSRGEAFGMVPLESLASGTPIVATACTGHSEYLKPNTPGAVVIEHGGYGPIDDWDGAVAPTVSPDAIAVALEIAYKQWRELKTAAVAAAPEVQQRWAWHAVLAPWIEQVRNT